MGGSGAIVILFSNLRMFVVLSACCVLDTVGVLEDGDAVVRVAGDSGRL